MYAIKTRIQPTTTVEGEQNYGLRDVLVDGRRQRLDARLGRFGAFLRTQAALSKHLYMREIVSPADREVIVADPFTGEQRPMLMFGSNNYLGLANHPHVRQQVRAAIDKYGVGIGGPPLLNGYTGLHRQLEERLAEFKGTEDAILFPTGYAANLGLLGGLTQDHDNIVYDALSHASFIDGLRMTRAGNRRFRHNDVEDLQKQLMTHAGSGTDTFVGVEGVYSMDGDLAPLDQIVDVCRRHQAILILDDAHGTAVMGAAGRGTAEHFGVERHVDITVGTFSKVFSVTGGFVAASKPIIDYLRFFARSHMFSASLSPMVVAAVLAGFDVIENEPERVAQLRANIAYTRDSLWNLGVKIDTESPILAVRVPARANIHEAARRFHAEGLFVNGICYPAVAANEQRFRISLMATHTRDDLDRLISCVAEIHGEWETDSSKPTLS